MVQGNEKKTVSAVKLET